MLAHKLNNIDELNTNFEKKQPQEIIKWAIEEFSDRLALTSSFGPESGTLLHMVSQIDKNVKVLFLETGYHFPDTLQYRDQLVDFLGLSNVVDLRANSERKDKIVKEYDGVPYEKNPDLCCQINKVEPLDEALKDQDAWISGIRRRQTDFRKSIQIIEEYEGEIYKISPLANFTSRDAWWYLKEHKVPQHPLFDKGYLSIGCWPCTRPVQEGDDERSGRWAGKSKQECGIHTFKEVKESKDIEKETPNDDISSNI